MGIVVSPIETGPFPILLENALGGPCWGGKSGAGSAADEAKRAGRPQSPLKGAPRPRLPLQKAATSWQAEPSGEPLQRIYGISFPSAQQLAAWERAQEQAAQRDHRRIGKVGARGAGLALLLPHPEAPGRAQGGLHRECLPGPRRNSGGAPLCRLQCLVDRPGWFCTGSQLPRS